MIVSAAAIVYRPREPEIILPLHRHKDVSTIMSKFGYGSASYSYQEGFLTDRGEFLDRYAAARYAYKCGQLIEDAETEHIYLLMSEDLW